MERRPNKEFGKRGPIAPQPVAPPKRSRHVALLLMGTFAVGGGAFALMPRQNCQSSPGVATPAISPSGTDCTQRGSTSSGGHGGSGSSWSRTSFFSSDSSSSSSHTSSGMSSDSGSSGVARGGFGSFAHAFSAHFSGGG